MSEPVESPKPKRKNAPRAAAVVPPGYTEAPKRLSLEQASEWVRAIPGVTPPLIRTMAKEGRWPANIPTNPDKTYPDFMDKGGWPMFLRGEGKVEWWPYGKVREWARERGFKTSMAWYAYAKNPGLPTGVPYSPGATYKKEFEEDGGWGGFLDVPRIRSKYRQICSFEEAGQWGREKGLTTVVEWLQWMRDHPGERPEHIPAAPANAYPDFVARGGWNAFLGTRALSGSSASERVIGQELQAMMPEKVEKGYPIQLEKGKKKRFDLVIPEKSLVIEYDGWYFHKDHVERDREQTRCLQSQGWKVVRIRELPLDLLDEEWDMFIDKKLTYFNKCVSVLVHLEKLGLVGEGVVERYEAKGDLWTDIKSLTQWKTWEEASEWFRSQEIKTGNEWKKWQREKERPADIPACPNNVYEGWMEKGGWGGFLGTGALTSTEARKAFLDSGYEETRNWFRSQRILSYNMWREWKKSNKKPPHIPGNPEIVFADEFERDGGWGGFTGSGELSNAQKSKLFGTYEEVRQWFIEKGIGTTGEWKRWKAENIRPSHVPSYPDEVFSEEFSKKGGWSGFFGREVFSGKKNGP